MVIIIIFSFKSIRVAKWPRGKPCYIPVTPLIFLWAGGINCLKIWYMVSPFCWRIQHLSLSDVFSILHLMKFVLGVCSGQHILRLHFSGLYRIKPCIDTLFSLSVLNSVWLWNLHIISFLYPAISSFIWFQVLLHCHMFTIFDSTRAWPSYFKQ